MGAPSGTGWNLKGGLTRVSNEHSATAYTAYDELGRVLSSQQTTEGAANPFAFSYTYNTSGSLTSMRYPSGRVVSLSYDDGGRIARVYNGTTDYARGVSDNAPISYAPHGAIQQMRLANGLVETAGYNSRLQMTSLSAGSLLSLSMDYGGATNNGNLLSQTITNGGVQFMQTYSYDALNRLATFIEGNVAQTYVYDRYGNRALWMAAGQYIPGQALTPTVGESSPAAVEALFPDNKWNWTGTVGDCHDPGGNQTCLPGQRSYQYDGENRLTQARETVGGTTYTSTYVYDGEGRRVKKTTGGVVTVYVYDAAGQLAAEYGGAADASGTEVVTVDYLGSTRLVTDGNQQPVKCLDYLPFGEELTVNRTSACYTSALEPRLKFTGKERDTETGLDFFGTRYLASAQGRFTSPDPLLASGRVGEPQTWNRYGYGRNNPLRFIDPSGLDYYDANGNRIGATDDEKNYIVTDKDQIKKIKKSKTTVAVADVSSAILLPNGKVISAIGDAVTRSNNPSGADTQGGFHEEGGQYGQDANGNQVAVAAAPGAYANPQTDSQATVNTGVAANPPEAGLITTVQGGFHVHPKGEIIVGSQSGTGTVVFGGTMHTYNFNQQPSPGDLANAQLRPGTTNFVVGARTAGFTSTTAPVC